MDNPLQTITVRVPGEALDFLTASATAAGFPLDHWCSLLIMRTVVQDRMPEGETSEDTYHHVRRSAKLTDDQVRYIISMRGIRTRLELAEELGVNVKHITNIWTGRAWKHLQPAKVED